MVHNQFKSALHLKNKVFYNIQKS